MSVDNCNCNLLLQLQVVIRASVPQPDRGDPRKVPLTNYINFFHDLIIIV